jgi:hypothetical protein
MKKPLDMAVEPRSEVFLYGAGGHLYQKQGFNNVMKK